MNDAVLMAPDNTITYKLYKRDLYVKRTLDSAKNLSHSLSLF